MAKEFEAKFTSINAEFMRKKLSELGFSCKTPEFLMVRKTLHPAHTTKNEWFRVRQESDKTTMTYKCIHSNDLDGIEEWETTVGDIDAATEILIKAGLKNTSTQENRREIWSDGVVEICIDTWPGLAPYVEIEGENADVVKEYVDKLGFDFDEGLYGGSEVVYEKELGIPTEVLIKLPSITFDKPPRMNAGK